jgi:hypothetical protein
LEPGVIGGGLYKELFATNVSHQRFVPTFRTNVSHQRFVPYQRKQLLLAPVITKFSVVSEDVQGSEDFFTHHQYLFIRAKSDFLYLSTSLATRQAASSGVSETRENPNLEFACATLMFGGSLNRRLIGGGEDGEGIGRTRGAGGVCKRRHSSASIEQYRVDIDMMMLLLKGKGMNVVSERLRHPRHTPAESV